MFSRTKRGILTGLGALLISCTGSSLEQSTHSPTTEDTPTQTDDSSSTLPSPEGLPHYRPTSIDDVFSYLPSFDVTSDTPQPSESAADTSTTPPDTSNKSEPEKWVQVGNDHHQKWCPLETPIYIAGKCVTLEQVICTDSDKTEAFFKKSSFGDYFEETIAISDPSLGLGGTVTFSQLADLTIQEVSLDTCKNNFILEEYYCSDGLPQAKSIKCNDYLLNSSCAVDEQGRGFCQPLDICPTVVGNQASFIYDNDGDGVNDNCEALDVCPTIEGLQTNFLFDTDNDGKNDSCLPDYCPKLAGIQEEFPYDNDNDGIPESCEVDLCPSIPGIQAFYVYDTDNNGTLDSCDPVDVCPNVEGIQTVLLYDTDNDGINDSCSPDFCPEIAGVQSAFPFDNDQDGVNESCIHDFCPDTLVPGIQSDYLYDVDGDGIKESCVPVDKNFCSDPDPQKTYPDATLYSYSDQWHMGFCLDGNENKDKVLHVICSEDGTWHTDVTECKLDMPCVQGACAECSDSDNGVNFDEKGYVLWLEKDGTVGSHTDYCLKTNETDYRTDFLCKGNTWDVTFEACPDGEKCLEDIVDGTAVLKCIPGSPPTCEDSDGKDNFSNAGNTTGFTKEGDAYSHNDYCLSTTSIDVVIDYYCDNGISKPAYLWCNLDEICQEEITSVDGKVAGTLKCVPAPTTPTCQDSDGPDNFPQKGYINGMDKHGQLYTHNDYCIGGGQYQGIMDWKCSENNTPQSSFYDCKENELCKELTKTENGTTYTSLACVPSCIDTDPDNNPTIAGTVFDFNNVPYPDVCEGDVLYQYECDSLTGEKMEAGMTNCANGCDGGMCK